MTPAELRTDVLLELERIATGETPSGDDSTVVDNEYTKLHAYLRDPTRRLAWWNADDSIPDEAARPVTILMAHRLSRKYGKNPIYRQQIEWDAQGRGNPNSAVADLTTLANENRIRTSPATHY